MYLLLRRTAANSLRIKIKRKITLRWRECNMVCINLLRRECLPKHFFIKDEREERQVHIMMGNKGIRVVHSEPVEPP